MAPARGRAVTWVVRGLAVFGGVLGGLALVAVFSGEGKGPMTTDLATWADLLPWIALLPYLAAIAAAILLWQFRPAGWVGLAALALLGLFVTAYLILEVYFPFGYRHPSDYSYLIQGLLLLPNGRVLLGLLALFGMLLSVLLCRPVRRSLRVSGVALRFTLLVGMLIGVAWYYVLLSTQYLKF